MKCKQLEPLTSYQPNIWLPSSRITGVRHSPSHWLRITFFEQWEKDKLVCKGPPKNDFTLFPAFLSFHLNPWRNGRASVSRSEVSVFKLRRGQNFTFSVYQEIEPFLSYSHEARVRIRNKKNFDYDWKIKIDCFLWAPGNNWCRRFHMKSSFPGGKHQPVFLF